MCLYAYIFKYMFSLTDILKSSSIQIYPFGIGFHVTIFFVFDQFVY